MADSEYMEDLEKVPFVKCRILRHLGMFDYKKEDEPIIMKTLIYDLKPDVAAVLVPGLPAYILFMCIRHTDYINDNKKVQSLLNNTVRIIRKTVKEHYKDLEYSVLWLTNGCRLLNNLKQYSGDKAFQIENKSYEERQCLQNFDLSEYWQLLWEMTVWIYQTVIKLMKERVQNLIVPAILEREAICMFHRTPEVMKGQSFSFVKDMKSPGDVALETILYELNDLYEVLTIHGVDQEIISQIYKQIFYFICAEALNNFLLRKDMCHCTKSIQINYNLCNLELWLKDHMQDCVETLAPLVEVCNLLRHANDKVEDLQSVCESYESLTTAQIITILNLYTPIDDFEPEIPTSTIRRIQMCLQKRDNERLFADRGYFISPNTLLVDSKYTYPIRFPFKPSNIPMKDISIPDVLDLHHVLKKI